MDSIDCGGKDSLSQLDAQKWSYLCKTVGLMLKMYDPIIGGGNTSVLDSGFFM